MTIPTSRCDRPAFKLAIVLALITSVLSPADLAAQGQPVQTGPMLPVGLWWIGAFVLGLAIAYGILRNRRRTRAEKALTEQATKDRYAEGAREEERDKVRSGSL
jgi:hypothetical protein